MIAFLSTVPHSAQTLRVFIQLPAWIRIQIMILIWTHIILLTMDSFLAPALQEEHPALKNTKKQKKTIYFSF